MLYSFPLPSPASLIYWFWPTYIIFIFSSTPPPPRTPAPKCEREPELQTVKPEGHFPAVFQHAPPARLHGGGDNKTKPLQPPVIICLLSQQSEKVLRLPKVDIFCSCFHMSLVPSGRLASSYLHVSPECTVTCKEHCSK